MKRTVGLFSAGVWLAVTASGFGQPIIIVQPQSQTNVAGSTMMLSVEATGTEPLSYQWRRNSSALAGQTNSNLIFTNLQAADTGNYAAVVTNIEGAVTSSVALVRVILPPTVTAQPSNMVADVGGTAAFGVTASGSSNLRYQWHFNNGAITGKTNATMTIGSVQFTNAGFYHVVVTNLAGAVTSRLAVLTVGPVPHGFGGVSIVMDGGALLGMNGVARALFTPYYDLYVLDAATNLSTWSHLAMIQRTNADPRLPVFHDREASNYPYRFYRTPTNHLVTFLPPPTGPHPVGTQSRLLTDTSRTNTMRRTHHQFMVSLWYPARPDAGTLPVPYTERPLAQSSYWYGQYTDRVPFFVSHSFSNAPLANSPERFPILLYSPGADLHRRDNTDKAEELASHGYIVVGLDHRETPLSVFPDGSVVPGEPVIQTSYSGSIAQIQERLLDERFVLDELARIDASDSIFAGRLDLHRIGAYGFSRGGAVSAQLCYNDSRCKAGVNIDGWFLVSNAVQVALPRPFLFLRSDTPDIAMPDGRPDDFRPTFDLMTTNAYFVVVAQSDHWNFDSYFFRNQTPAFRRVHQIWTAYILSFFNRHLLHQDDHLLECPSSYPEVIECQRK